MVVIIYVISIRLNELLIENVTLINPFTIKIEILIKFISVLIQLIFNFNSKSFY